MSVNPNSPTKNADTKWQSPNDQSDFVQIINPSGGSVLGGMDYTGVPYGTMVNSGGGGGTPAIGGAGTVQLSNGAGAFTSLSVQNPGDIFGAFSGGGLTSFAIQTPSAGSSIDISTTSGSNDFHISDSGINIRAQAPGAALLFISAGSTTMFAGSVVSLHLNPFSFTVGNTADPAGSFISIDSSGIIALKTNNGSFVSIDMFGHISIGSSITDSVGFFGAASITKPTVTGAKGGNAALASLLTALAAYGLIVDSTT